MSEQQQLPQPPQHEQQDKPPNNDDEQQQQQQEQQQPETKSEPDSSSAKPAAAAAATAAAEVDDTDDDEDEDAEIVEESPCGRWLKRREEIKYRDVPGIDTAYLAMDSEEGVEVVWNEATFSTHKKFLAQEQKLKNVFEALTLIDHPNIVRFHRYWTDPGTESPVVVVVSSSSTTTTTTTAADSSPSTETPPSTTMATPTAASTATTTTTTATATSTTSTTTSTTTAPPASTSNSGPSATADKPPEKKLPRLIFITEYMSSGSLKQFLRRTKKNNRKIQLQSWKRWCTQILSALSYLHQTCSPPIVHGNLTCDTIFIQHNGLVKIGSIAPDMIHQNVKTCRGENIRNVHCLAPEFVDDHVSPGPPSDVYAFGMCALETAALDLQPNPIPTVIWSMLIMSHMLYTTCAFFHF